MSEGAPGVRVSALAPGPPERAWDRLAGIASWPEWNPLCEGARLEGPLAPGTRMELELRPPTGRAFVTRPRLVAVERPRALAWEARALGLRARTGASLAPEEDGTRVTIEAHSRGPMAFTYRLTLPDGTQAAMLSRMLDALVESLS